MRREKQSKSYGFPTALLGSVLLLGLTASLLFIRTGPPQRDSLQSSVTQPAHHQIRSSKRHPASPGDNIDPVKMKNLMAGSSIEHVHKFGKPRAFLQVSVRGSGKFQPQTGEPFTLIGTVRAPQNLDHVTVSWNLPSGVHVVSGPQTETLWNLKSEEEREVEITLVSRSSENQHVYFEAYQERNGERHGGTAQYNTVLQHSLEAEAKERRLKVQSKGESSRFHKLIQ